MSEKAYQAWGPAGRVTEASPREAAERYFRDFPKSRKCNVVEGVVDGHFFTIRYGRASTGEWPYSVKDITRKTAGQLPA